MGLPSASFTFDTLVVKLCTRSDTLREAARVNGLTRYQPAFATVPR